MKKLLGALALFAATTSPAWAGFGATAYMGSYQDGTAWYPSLDYRAKGILVQVHLLDWIQGVDVTTGDPVFAVNAGADVTGIAVKRKVGPDVEGVFMPGAGVRITSISDTMFWNVMAQGRLGAEMKQGMGFGIYVVPAVGVTNMVTGDLGLNYGGTLQVSTWFMNK
ncbi:MAG: hypothetical protein ACOZNI_06890 [Myxococcota bacterium]